MIAILHDIQKCFTNGRRVIKCNVVVFYSSRIFSEKRLMFVHGNSTGQSRTGLFLQQCTATAGLWKSRIRSCVKPYEDQRQSNAMSLFLKPMSMQPS